LSQPEKGRLPLTDNEKGFCVFRPYDNVVGQEKKWEEMGKWNGNGVKP